MHAHLPYINLRPIPSARKQPSFLRRRVRRAGWLSRYQFLQIVHIHHTTSSKLVTTSTFAVHKSPHHVHGCTQLSTKNRGCVHGCTQPVHTCQQKGPAIRPAHSFTFLLIYCFTSNYGMPSICWNGKAPFSRSGARPRQIVSVAATTSATFWPMVDWMTRSAERSPMYMATMTRK